MKKKLKVPGILVLAISIIMAFSACGSLSPTETADSFLTAFKASDTETMLSLYAEDKLGFFEDIVSEIDVAEDKAEEDATEEEKAFAEDLMAKITGFDYELSNEQIDGDKASVDVQITTYDFAGAYNKTIEAYFTYALENLFSDISDEEANKKMDEYLTKYFGELEEKNHIEKATIEMKKVDDVWKICGTDDEGELANAILGGVIKATEELENSFDE